LFLFVVMMLDIDFRDARRLQQECCRSASPVAAVCWPNCCWRHGGSRAGVSDAGTPDGAAMPAAGDDNTRPSARCFIPATSFVFEIAGIILLVAMIGAIVLTHRRRKPGNSAAGYRQAGPRTPEDATS
jgi:NADH-quinone oxidoreductase subunit J